MDGILGAPPTVRGFFAYNTAFQTGYIPYIDHGITNLLYERVETLFMDRFKARYAELRANVLTADNIIDVYERLTDTITNYDGLLEEDFASTTGGGSFTGIPYQSENNIQQLRNFVAARLPYMDEQVAAIEPPAEQIPCTGITLDQTTLTFDGAGTQTLTAMVMPSDTTDTVVWSSDDASVASVSGGVVTAKANGSATITATCGAYSATCAVSVSGIEAGAIPAEYERLEYIQSSGTQYINSGVSGGTNAEYEFDFAPSDLTESNYSQYLGGNKNSTITKLYKHTTIGMCGTSVSAAKFLITKENEKRVIVKYASNGETSVDGTVVNTSTTDAGKGWGDLKWQIFNSNDETPGKGKLYSLKMWTDGELVRDFVPVMRVSDSAYGLYDLIGAAFYENAGTGAFTGA